MDDHLERFVSDVVFWVHVLLDHLAKGCRVQNLSLCFVNAVLVVLQLIDADEAVLVRGHVVAEVLAFRTGEHMTVHL